MPVYTRASRLYKFVPAIGSCLAVQQYSDLGVLSNPTLLDIAGGTLTENPINADVTNSGSAGGVLRERVGFDWNFALNLQFPAQLLGGALAAEFVDQIVGSSNHIRVTFNMGDPLYWTVRGLSPRSKRGRCLLSLSETRFVNDAKQVVGVNLAGEGSDLLFRYLGEDQQGAPLWG